MSATCFVLCKYVVTSFVQNNFYNFISVLETEPQNLDFVISSAMSKHHVKFREGIYS